MFLVTLNKKTLRKIGTAAVCCVLAAAGFVGVRHVLGGRNVAAGTLVNTTVESTQDMQIFFAGYGLEVDLTQTSVDKVKVPKKWDDSFQAFNTVVMQSGLSLANYKGKTVEKWLVPVPKLSDGENTTYAVLLVKDKKAVGAYLLAKPSGEVTGLADAARSGAQSEEQPSGAQAEDTGEEVDLDVDLVYDGEGYPIE